MKQILLVCGTGASSGFMAKNIRQAIKARACLMMLRPEVIPF